MVYGSMRFRSAAPLLSAVLAASLVIAAVENSGAAPQFPFGRYFSAPEPEIPHFKYDGRFALALLKYETGPGGYYYRGLPAWAHGWPRAEENLMRILDAITTIHPHQDETVVVALDDAELDKYPVAYMAEAGYWTMNAREAAGLRNYLLKGGFVIFDDFRPPPRGGGGWDNFAANMARVIPNGRWEPLTPSDTPFHVFFDIDSFAIIPQSYDMGRPEIYGLYEDNDRDKRLMAVANYNTDISDFWEFSGTGMLPVEASNEAYEIGVNYVIYGLTH